MRFTRRDHPGPCLALSALCGLGGLFLVGCGGTVGSTLFPQIGLSRSTISFPSQVVGAPDLTQTATITNTGRAPLSIAEVGLTGTDRAMFAVSNGCPAPLAPGASCTVSATFAPTSGGSFAATLQINGNSATSASISLSGTGLAPAVQLSPAQVTFTSVEAGITSNPIAVQLTDTGTAPLAVTSIAIAGSGASAFHLLPGTCGQTLATGASCTVSVTFTPRAAGNDTAMLSFTDSAGATAQVVPLAGTGTPGTPLSAWNDAYRRCHTEPVNIFVLGDSRSVVDTTIMAGLNGSLAATFGQKWPDRLAATLAATCGSHGTGLVPFLPLAKLPSVNGDFYTIDGSWTTLLGIGPFQFGSVQAALTLAATSPATIRFSTAQPFDHLNAYCVIGPGLNPWTLSIDGRQVGSCGGEGPVNGAALATSSAVPLATHTAELSCAQAPCAAYGLEATVGTTGISVHNLAVGSCAAECFGLNPAAQLAFSDLIPGHHLVVIDLVTNEPGVGYSTDSFYASLGNIIDHERALPVAPSVLIVAPLQDDLPGQAPFYPILPQVADRYATAFFDLRDTYGSAFFPQFFGPDGAHENNDGHNLIYQKVLSTLVP